MKMIWSTYGVQTATVLIGAASLWMALYALSEGRYFAVAVDVLMALVNGYLFCAQASLRSKLETRR
jgi:hypothetical protein